jgi:ferredoxin
MMRIVIDETRCSGNGRCYTLEPALFTDDDRGYGQVIGDGLIAEDKFDAASRAVVACPEDAISINDDEPVTGSGRGDP